MKAVILTTFQWKKIRKALQEEHKASVFMLRSRMKDVLGFTVREHNDWKNGEYEFQIHLDFYSANKRTMFLLKFSELIHDKD